jgi:rhamnose transport system substrate-binding protein
LARSAPTPSVPGVNEPTHRDAARRARLMRSGRLPAEAVLTAVLLLEVTVFGLTTDYFFTAGNFFEVARFATALGLLALAMTPVIVTGGIDLSVGAMMGLAAVSLGVMWHDWDWPVLAAGIGALGVGGIGGIVNGFFIARLGVPPLIVTLGSMALFRGIAEGISGGSTSYSGFPASFHELGQGYIGGVIPAQVPLLVTAAIAAYLLLQRSTIGRALYAIGFNPAGARYAGLPVRRRLLLVYGVSGVAAALAALVYVSHIGQARSDAGNGYELSAITAVILGGAAVTGGRGTIAGTLLGLFVLAVLQNGLQLAALPSELVGVLTGVVLVGAIGLDHLQASRPSGPPASKPSPNEVPVKNSQVAILCTTIIAGALTVAGTNAWLFSALTRGGATSLAVASDAAPVRRPVVAMMPKAKGDPYFVSCRTGAEEAAREFGVELIWDGPTGLDAARQNELVESWITRRVDAIAVSVENRASISTALRKARERGIKVITWDADAEPDARDYFVNQATPEGIGTTLVDEAATLMGGSGEFAIITGALAAPNQNAWIEVIRRRIAEAHPSLTIVTIRPSDDDRDKAFAEAQTIMRVHPSVKLIMAIAAPAVPGAAEAVRQANRRDINVMGLSLPNMNKPYVHDGIVQTVILWNTTNLGYLTVRAAALAATGQLAPGASTIDGGRLGSVEVRGEEILLGTPLVMTKDNIDGFDF